MLFFSCIRRLIIVFAFIAGIAVLIMTGVTVADVVLRLFNVSITGAYDLVRVCGVLAVACALPYLTAVKGHIAIEFFYHRCGRFGRIVMDTFFRITSLGMFGILTVQLFRHGLSLLKTGEIFPNLGIPVFWIPMVISLNSALMMIVFFYHMMHPGKVYIKP